MHLVQKELFKNINDDKLKQLRPIIDCNGLIRAKTNVSNRVDTNDFRYPIIFLPSDHIVVNLLIMNAHNDLLHAGTSMLMSHLREKYWIIKDRILPKDRVRDAVTFEIVGVDLAGTLYLKHSPKAVLFLVVDARDIPPYILTTPRILSDQRLLHVLDWDSILARVAEEKIQWKFNPPSASWWGGWWERLVQMTKAILRKILGRAALDSEELITVLCDCERGINSRRLTYVSEDVDVSPLTPEMFLREIPV
ncbi:integrase catalytic domain-containing protein [Trichonephila clavipes]|nr:integrase catalytic domain-containing protein [Trichonephila clavipes]